MFKESLDSLRNRSTQCIVKWAASFRVTESVLARGKLRGKVSTTAKLRGGEQGKGKKRPSRDVNPRRGDQDGGLEVQQRPVRAYSVRHQQWINAQVDRHVPRQVVVDESHTGDTDRPPDGNIGVHCTPTTT